MRKGYLILIAAGLLAACTPEKPDSQNKPEDSVTENPAGPEDPGGNGSQDPDTPEVPEPEVPQESYYVEVAEDFSDWSGDYLITYTSGSNVLVLSSHEDTKGYGKDISSALTSQGIHSDDGDQYKAIVEKSGNGYTINVSGIGYLGLENAKNSVNASAAAQSSDNYRWTFSYKDGGSVWIKNAGHSGYRLQWNASANIFRCYTGSQKELTLYRRGISTGGNGGGSTPAPDPTPDPNPEPDPEQPGDEDIPTPVPGQSGKYGWYELPVISYSQSGNYLIDSKDKDLYYAHHICAGNEKGPDGKKARNYTVCYSAEHHCPV